MSTNFQVRLPENSKPLPMNKEYFFITENGVERCLRLHDYAAVYSIPGLYEYLLLEKLNYRSHEFMASLLNENLKNSGESIQDLKILDLGAGTGLFGQAISKFGIESIIGIDIIPEAAQAAQRDYPGIYEDYFVEDLTQLSPTTGEVIKQKKLNCFVCCSAFADDHIPGIAFATGVNLIENQGWVLFNVSKNCYECESNCPDFVNFYRQLIEQGYLQIHCTESYLHRHFFSGHPLEFVAILAKKQADIPIG
ncbi:MAG: methyltransferase domain-containing protein [Sphaerospermopsis sp. SIO1G2]|nr:methyltransferase domain-containing protein [Sphaerospermopsis sp. SIO1G2]